MEKELWTGKPSYWVAIYDIVQLIKEFIVISIVFVLVPETLNNIMWYVSTGVVGRRIIKIGILLLSTKYKKITLTEDRFIFEFGILSRVKKVVELYKVKDFTLYEPFWFRFFKLQRIGIMASGHSRFYLTGIPKQDDLYETIRSYVERARERKGITEYDCFQTN